MQAPDEVQQQVAERLNLSKVERANTRQCVEDGDLLKANSPERVETRKNRILNAKNVTSILGATVLRQLESHSVQDSSVETQQAFERAIKGNDALPGYYLAEGARVRRTVGRIHIRDAQRRIGWGTGFLVGPNLLLTNQHVLDLFDTARFSRVEFDYEEDSTGSVAQTAIFDLAPDVLFVSNPAVGGLDFALVAVAPVSRPDSPKRNATLTEYGYNVLYAELGKLLKGEAINAVHHPEGQTRQISIRQNSLTGLDTPALKDTWMHYETDTEEGSSGAPLFNDQWEVVGIHHMGVELRNEQGDILAVGNVPWTRDMGEKAKLWEANEGLRISQFLKQVQVQVNAVMNNDTDLRADDRVSDEGKALFDQMINRTKPTPVSESVMRLPPPGPTVTNVIRPVEPVISTGSFPE